MYRKKLAGSALVGAAAFALVPIPTAGSTNNDPLLVGT